MSFLRSVIADASPRKIMRVPVAGSLPISGWKSSHLEGNDSGVDQQSQRAAEQTSRSSKSLSNREGTHDVNIDTSAFQEDNPLTQDTHDLGRRIELESPFPGVMDTSEPITNEKSSIRLDPVNLPEHQLDYEGVKAVEKPGSMTQEFVDTLVPGGSMNSTMSQRHNPSITFPATHDAQHRVSGHEGMELLSYPASISDTSTQEEVTDVLALDDQCYPDGSINGADTLTNQADTTQIAALSLPGKSRQVESRVFDATVVPADYSPESFGNPTADNSAGRNEIEETLVDDVNSRHKSPKVDKQADIKSLSNHEDIPQLQKLSEAESVHSDVQGVSRKSMASQGLSDRVHASVPQSAGKKGQASAVSPNSVIPKAGNSEQHVDSPVSPSVSPEAFRFVSSSSVLQTDAIPKTDAIFPSRSRLSPPDSFEKPTSDNRAEQDEVETALVHGGNARHGSHGVDKQADIKSLSSQEIISQLQKLGEAQGVHRDFQGVSRKAMVMASKGLSDKAHASVPQRASKKGQASAVSPDSVIPKAGTPEQHVARPASPPERPETFRSVPAKRFQMDLMPKAGDTFPSRPQQRKPEKTHEAPKVQIGQIDVIIEAAPPQPTNQAPTASSIDLSSRYYLRRL